MDIRDAQDEDMSNWVEEKLKEVDKKHAIEKKRPTTEIVSLSVIKTN